MKNLIVLLLLLASCTDSTESDFKQSNIEAVIIESNIKQTFNFPNVQYSSVALVSNRLVFTDVTNCNLKADALNETFKDFYVESFKVNNEISKNCK